eukprot:1362919-Rhodomonas_salina.1
MCRCIPARYPWPSGELTFKHASCLSTSLTPPGPRIALPAASSASVHTWCPMPLREPAQDRVNGRKLTRRGASEGLQAHAKRQDHAKRRKRRSAGSHEEAQDHTKRRKITREEAQEPATGVEHDAHAALPQPHRLCKRFRGEKSASKTVSKKSQRETNLWPHASAAESEGRERRDQLRGSAHNGSITQH